MTGWRILAIDGAGGVAVAAGESGSGGSAALRAGAGRSGPGDADLLPDKVRACLAAAGWTMGDVDVIACGIGPGGFTAIRVAVALARGLALAAARPTLAVTSFEAIAGRARLRGIHGPLRVVVPGGRGNWFVQDMVEDRPEPSLPAILTEPPEDWGEWTLVGSGGSAVVEVAADAADVMLVAAGRLRSGERPAEGDLLVPLYLRGADARPGAGRSLLEPVGT